MNIKTTVEITDDQIYGLLCTAFEGGVGYWCQLVNYQYAPGLTKADFREGGKHYNDRWVNLYLLVPMVPGCAVVVTDLTEYEAEPEDEATMALTRETIEKGLQIMANDYPRHFSNLLTENDDAITGDVFLQCCLFESVIYG